MGNLPSRRSTSSVDLEINNLRAKNEILKKHLHRSNELLKTCSTQVGMMMGESILSHLSDCEGTKFNSVEYHYEKPVGEQ